MDSQSYESFADLSGGAPGEVRVAAPVKQQVNPDPQDEIARGRSFTAAFARRGTPFNAERPPLFVADDRFVRPRKSAREPARTSADKVDPARSGRPAGWLQPAQEQPFVAFCQCAQEQSLSSPSGGGGLPGTNKSWLAVRAAITLPLVHIVVTVYTAGYSSRQQSLAVHAPRSCGVACLLTHRPNDLLLVRPRDGHLRELSLRKIHAG